MSSKCISGIHDWNGCYCQTCGKRRDEGHRWDGCRCSLCGKTRNEGHDFLNVELTCKKCKTVLDMNLKDAYEDTLVRAMPILLKELMFHLENSKKALTSLERIGWQPQSLEEHIKVYFLRGNKQALISLGSEAVPGIIKEISWNTEFAADVLGEIGASMTNSEDELKCRDSIVLALILQLETYNHSHSHDPERSLALIKALGQIGDARALPHFIAEMRNEYMDMPFNRPSAEAVVDMISNLGVEAVPDLVKELHNPRRHVPGLAVKALLKIGQPAVPELVKELTSSGDVHVRPIILKTLAELGWQPQTIDEKIPVWLDRKDFAELIKIGPPGTNALIRELQATPGILGQYPRKDIIDVLGTTGDRSAVPALMQILLESDAAWSVSGIAAASALGKIGDRSAVPALIRVISTGNAKEEHIEALAMLSDGQAPSSLLEILKTGEQWQRTAVAIALEKTGDRSAVPDLITALARAEAEESYREYNAISNALFKFGHPDSDYLYIPTHIAPVIDDFQYTIWIKKRRDEITSSRG